jgi:hypothetical protein
LTSVLLKQQVPVNALTRVVLSLVNQILQLERASARYSFVTFLAGLLCPISFGGSRPNLTFPSVRRSTLVQAFSSFPNTLL